MSCGLDSTGKSCGAPGKVEFFLSDKDGARQLRERSYEYSHRLLSSYSVQFELSRSPNPSAKGEWITLTGPRDNLEKAKELILHSLLPTCCVELASSHQTSAEQLLTTSKSMALAVHVNHYDTTAGSLSPPPPPSSTVPFSQNMSPPCLYQSSHHHSSSSISPPHYPLNVDTQTRVEPTPTTTTIDSKEQHLRNVILQLSPEQLKNILLDATTQQHQQAPSHHQLQGGRSHRLLSRSPDQREKKIDYFVNTLNYPREKVESVLDQLGPDAADNDILERLVRVCKPSNVKPTHSNSSIIGNTGGGGGTGVYRLKYPGETSVTPPSQFSPPLPMSGGSIVPPQPLPVQDPARLRYIVIDGSNVAMRHGNGNFYSCRGIQLAVDFFRRRGHDKITVFVPEWRKEASRPETPIADQDLLHLLEREGVLKYTPSRRIRGKRVACYDDRFILDLATNKDGVIVSNDQFRDLMDDKPEWREVVETRLLPFQFVDDLFMPASDPMGKDGPTLDEILVINPTIIPGRQKLPPSGSSGVRQLCPYQEKCTFGRKCKFYHPEREGRSDQPVVSAPQSSTSPVDSRTPNASRSATPSPSPEKWPSRYSHSNRSSGEDLRGVSSHNGSTDDLSSYHQVSAQVDISELQQVMQGSLRIHDGPPLPPPGPLAPTSNQQGFYDYPRNSRHVPPHSVNIPPATIHSAPVFSNTPDSAAASTQGDSSQHPHRYTFPMAVLPHPHHVNSRTHVVTEQHHRVVLPGTSGLSGTGGVASAVGIPPLAPELDPSIMYPSSHHHQHHPVPPQAGFPAGYHPQDVSVLPPSTNPVSHQAAGSQPMPGMFMTRDGWQLPSATHYPLTSHELHGHGGSLMPAPPGFYPSSQGHAPPGYNSRCAGADSSLHSSHSHSHSLGSSVSVPSTRTSPYHQRHIPQQQQHEFASHPHSQYRHQSIDFGNHVNISPQRRKSDVQNVNGHLPQANASSGYGGGSGAYFHDYSQQRQGSAFTGVTGAVGQPFHSSQSNIFSHSSSSHMAPAPAPQHLPLPPHPSHYHHLPSVNERPIENGDIVMDRSSKCAMLRNSSLFRKVSVVLPGCDEMILSVMMANVHVTDFEELVQLVKQVVVTSQ